MQSGMTNYPSYNTGAVTRMTGIKSDTPRSWERRYGLPQPNRSSGGQRLYSQHDLEISNWLIAQKSMGLRIRQAVELWHKQRCNDIDLLNDETNTRDLSNSTLHHENKLSSHRKAWVSACEQFNESKAEEIVAEAFSQYPSEVVCVDLLLAGISAIGDAWCAGKVSVQQEHFASELVARRLNALIAGVTRPTHPDPIVIASPPDEEHTLSSLLLTFLLRRQEWKIVYLGSNVPLENFRATVELLDPGLVILIAHQLFTAANLLDIANDIVDLPCALAYGGLIFNRIPDLRRLILGNFLGTDWRATAQAVERFIQNPAKKQSVPQASPATYLNYFISMTPAIETASTRRL